MHGGEDDDATTTTMEVEPSPEPVQFVTPEDVVPAPEDDIAVIKLPENSNEENVEPPVSDNVGNDTKSSDVPADNQLINTQKRYDLTGAVSAKRTKRGILKDHLNGNNNRRSVRFRDVIASFVEPVKVQNIDESQYVCVVDSYKEMCGKLRVRPCLKLLQQLEGLRDSTLRIDTIDLKGTRLDAAHCEALESVFRVVRAQTLDIEQTQLDDDGAISLFEMIEYYEPVTRLIVSHNLRLGVRAWLALARLLKKFHSLEYLDVRRTSLDESTMPLLCRVLKINCMVRVLHLEDNHLSGILIRNLVWGLRTNTHLQDLFLGMNRLTPEDAKQLGSLLIANHHIRLLDLRNNRLQDTGIMFLSSALEEQQFGLQLITVWSNQITASSMLALSRAMAFHHTLEGVNLGSNPIGNKGVECLKEGLLSSRSIARLVMASCHITNEGAVVMAEVIGDHTTLIHIDLRENNITLAGVMALKCAYAINTSLLRLHLDAMKKSTTDPLMEQLLLEIDGYSLRNLEHHKQRDNQAQDQQNALAVQNGQSIEEVKAKELQEQKDFQLAFQLQQQENKIGNVKEEPKPLPIISPIMAAPDEKQTMGFFTGSYHKLKQRLEDMAPYLRSSDTLAASAPSAEPKDAESSTAEVEETFEDAVEVQSDLDPVDPEQVLLLEPSEAETAEEATESTAMLAELRETVPVLPSSTLFSDLEQIESPMTEVDKDLILLDPPQPKLDSSEDSSETAVVSSPDPLSPDPVSAPDNLLLFDEVWHTGPEDKLSTETETSGSTFISTDVTTSVSESSPSINTEYSTDSPSSFYSSTDSPGYTSSETGTWDSDATDFTLSTDTPSPHPLPGDTPSPHPEGTKVDQDNNSVLSNQEHCLSDILGVYSEDKVTEEASNTTLCNGE